MRKQGTEGQRHKGTEAQRAKGAKANVLPLYNGIITLRKYELSLLIQNPVENQDEINACIDSISDCQDKIGNHIITDFKRSLEALYA